MKNSFIIFVIILLYGCGISSQDTGETIGTIIKHSNDLKGSSFIVKYTIENEYYYTSISGGEGRVIGDKYIIKYEINNPDKCKVLIYQPIFEKNENTNVTTGEVKRISTFLDRIIEFEYNVDGIRYKRWQKLPPNHKELYPGLAKGQKYQIQYLNTLPERAIIKLDKEIKNQ
ncbi:hypothetical protein ACFLTE_11530 [Bacteroidota bacterium]